jgi:hypothetical protein
MHVPVDGGTRGTGDPVAAQRVAAERDWALSRGRTQ